VDDTLHSPEQLPDIPGRNLVFAWDQEEADSIVTCGGKVVWRERTGWEVYNRFAEIAAILQRKYGARIKDLVPAPGSEFALYGDSSRGPMTVEAVRAQLASGAPRKYTYSELDDAIAKGLWETLNLYLVAGGDPSATHPDDGTTLLHLAARRHLPDVVRLLVAAGANVNALDRMGTSPLRAVLDDSSQIALKDSPDEEDEERKTLNQEIVKTLVDAGAV
jgi:ankyrin repeat protein